MKIEIGNDSIRVVFDNGRLFFSSSLYGKAFSQTFSPDSARVVGDELQIIYNADGKELSCRYSVQNGYIRLIIDSQAEDFDTLSFPPSFDLESGMTALIPYCEGVAFDVADAGFPLPDHLSLSGARGNSMSFFAYLDSGNPDLWIMCAVITNADAELLNVRDDAGILRTGISWLSEKGKWGYEREVRYYIGSGGIGGICRTYRKVAEEKGLVKTLAEKKKDVPNVDKLVGSANVWLWNDDAMEKLYSENAVLRVPTKEQYDTRVSIAQDMKNSGIDRVMWSVFDENVDAETVSEIKELGFLTTFYDIYTDVIPGDIADKIPATRRKRCEHRMKCWPDGIVIQKDGTRAKAWALKGIDGNFYSQNYVCDREALKCAAGFVPEHSQKYGLEGRFLDVVIMQARECYSVEHPMNRRESVSCKCELLASMGKMGLVCGTEVGREDIVPGADYNEGMMSPPIYRAYDAGRRMTNLYYGDEIDPKITGYMLNPKYRVPLFELVYHDCMVSYWYWGDSTNCCPELMPLRDMFSVLYGLPPIYSFRVADYEKLKEKIIASYQRTVPFARRVGYDRMIDFRYLTEDKTVQMTEFAGGAKVIANFGDRDFDNFGTVVPKHDRVIM